jgi:OmcA/MtrC family decaheme c-type cytochrome
MADGAVEVRLDSADGKLFTTSGGNGSAETGKWVKDGQTFFLVDKASGDVLQELPVSTTALGCNTNEPGTFRGAAGALHTNWLNHPSRAVCGSCHSDLDFESGEEHPAQTDDTRCGNCHRPDGDEFGRSIRGAHTVAYKSDQLGGIIIDVKGFEFAFQGGNVRVTFSIRDKNGPLDPNSLNRLLFTIAGPNEDFEYYNQESLVGSSNLKPSGANWTYRFANPLPKDAEGSYSLGIEGRIPAVLNEGEDNQFTVNDQMQNFIVPFAIGDASLMARRMVVDDQKCESCHSNLSLHGENRHNATEYCQTCHRPDATYGIVRLEGEDESIHFKYMVHKLHMGADLDRGYVVYGYRSSVHDYSHVEYPGDLRNCEACHVDDSYLLPLPDYALDTVAPADYWSPLSPTASTCMSCHDSLDVAAHVQANTSELGESCNLCHGDGAAFDIEKVHAR